MTLKASAGYSPAFGAATQVEVPTNGQTVSIIQTNSGNLYVLLKPGSALLSLSMQLPQGLFNGQTITIATMAPITTLNLTGFAVLGALTSLLANGFSKYVWVTSENSWVRCG